MSWDSIIVEPHPFDPFIKQDTQKLIIGTFPTALPNRQFGFYYSGKHNNFWKIIGKALGARFHTIEDPEATAERKKILEKHKIGITDMHQLCYRKNNKSEDADLSVIKLNDILSLLKEYPSINTLIFTSRTEVIGAWGLFKTYLLQQEVKNIPELITKDKLWHGSMTILNKNYKIWVPYSPSPLVIREKKITMFELEEMYKQSLM